MKAKLGVIEGLYKMVYTRQVCKYFRFVVKLIKNMLITFV